jgi:hypothetical protein
VHVSADGQQPRAVNADGPAAVEGGGYGEVSMRALVDPSGHRIASAIVRSLRLPLIGLATLALAAVPLAARAEDDLPGRVGRVADFAGQLLLSPQDRPTEWAPIDINYPITSGDNLWVSADGRAEADYGGGQFRIAGDTSLHISRLDDQQLSLFVAQGRLIVRVRALDDGEAARVDTPNTQVTLTRPGLYRIDVIPERQATTVVVREGEARVALASGAQQALPGQIVTVTGPEPATADIRSGFSLDGFDSWSADRDRRYERGRATAYVSRQMVGYAELDEYGSWESNPTYGPVWYPAAVAADWAPYRDGYWTSVGGWGLTWVDAAPWGYAPSHYGRWVRAGGRWGWCPGAFVARPHWAPALVAWYGGGTWGRSGSAGAPVYGWVPLGWGDPYHPSWRGCSHNCWARYNRPYAVNVAVRPAAPPARYSNAGVPGAMTAVAAPTLGSRKPVPTNRVPLPGSLAASAPVLALAPAVAPGPSRVPGLRTGEPGTPTPAQFSRTWPGRDAAVPVAKSSASPGGPARAGGAVPPPTGPGSTSPPSTFAPPSRIAPAPAAPSSGGPAATPREGGPPAAPPATTMTRSVAPAPAPLVESRRAAPVAPTPGAGGTVVAAPPARADALPQTQPPKPPVVSSPAAPLPASPQGHGRAGVPGAVNPGTGAPPPAGPGTGGLPMPPPRPVQAPMPAGRAAPVPSLGQPGPAPVGAPAALGAPAPAVGPAPTVPAPQARPHAKPSDAASEASGKAADKGTAGGGTVPR